MRTIIYDYWREVSNLPVRIINLHKTRKLSINKYVGNPI